MLPPKIERQPGFCNMNFIEYNNQTEINFNDEVQLDFETIFRSIPNIENPPKIRKNQSHDLKKNDFLFLKKNKTF